MEPNFEDIQNENELLLDLGVDVVYKTCRFILENRRNDSVIPIHMRKEIEDLENEILDLSIELLYDIYRYILCKHIHYLLRGGNPYEKKCPRHAKRHPRYRP